MKLGDAANMNVEVIPTDILPLDLALGVGGIPPLLRESGALGAHHQCGASAHVGVIVQR